MQQHGGYTSKNTREKHFKRQILEIMESDKDAHTKFVDTMCEEDTPSLAQVHANDDEHDLFCRALAKQMRQLSPEKQAFARVKIDTLMYEIRFNQASNVPVPVASTSMQPMQDPINSVTTIHPPSSFDYFSG